MSDEMVEAALAFISRLDPAAQHSLHERFSEVLSIPLDERSGSRRVSRVARSLFEAKRELGESPSVPQYKELRRAHPDWEWPDPRSVTRWLGVRSWNEALVRIGL